MKLVNLTPHSVHIHVDVMPAFGSVVEIPSSGIAPRCTVTSRSLGTIDVDGLAVPVTVATPGAVSGLPDPVDGVGYIVSRLVAEASPDRLDLYIPGEAVRDAGGRVIGCRGLCQIGGAP